MRPTAQDSPGAGQIPLNSRYDLPKVDPIQRDAWICERYRDSYSVDAIASAVGLGKTQVRNILGTRIPRRRPAPDVDEIMLAGLAWHAYYHDLPTSACWNATLARKTDESYIRLTMGWYKPKHPARSVRWPYEGRVVRLFGSFPAYHAELQREITRRDKAGQPFRPAPIPDWVRRAAEMCVWQRTMPRHRVDQAAIDADLYAAVAEVRRDWARSARRRATWDRLRAKATAATSRPASDGARSTPSE